MSRPLRPAVKRLERRVLGSLLGIALLAACGASGNQPGGVAGASSDPLEAIRAEALRAHVEFLADDLLEGRGTGTRGYAVAARYVAAELAAGGVEPAGENGYMSPVRLRRAEPLMEDAELVLHIDGADRRLNPGEDFIPGARMIGTEGEVDAPAVFAGHGVRAPALDHDDYADLDAAGKIVVVLAGAPAGFSPDAAAHYSSGATKAATAAASGAIGIITVATPAMDRIARWDVISRLSRRGQLAPLDAAGMPVGVRAEIRGSALVSRQAAAHLFAAAPRDLETVFEDAAAGRLESFPLQIGVRLRTASRHAEIESPNVIGVLRGSDPTLAEEYVVYTAHLDHEGIGEPRNGDAIYNGAIDNASGIASLIEVARAFQAAGVAPRRSILFVATAAEEDGLLGAERFVASPPVPIEAIVANVNMDGNHMLFPTSDIVVLGVEHSDLDVVAQSAADRVELELSPDPMPEQGFFVRSDHYPFVKAGIPAVALIGGFSSSDPDIDGFAAVQRWLQTTYHTPADDLSQDFHWESGVAYTRAAFLIGQTIANADAPPAWKPGNFFGETFGRS